MKGGFFALFILMNGLDVRVAAEIGKLEAGQDKLLIQKEIDELWRKQRNLDFKSNISEAYIAARSISYNAVK